MRIRPPVSEKVAKKTRRMLQSQGQGHRNSQTPTGSEQLSLWGKPARRRLDCIQTHGKCFEDDSIH